MRGIMELKVNHSTHEWLNFDLRKVLLPILSGQGKLSCFQRSICRQHQISNASRRQQAVSNRVQASTSYIVVENTKHFGMRISICRISFLLHNKILNLLKEVNTSLILIIISFSWSQLSFKVTPRYLIIVISILPRSQKLKRQYYCYYDYFSILPRPQFCIS